MRQSSGVDRVHQNVAPVHRLKVVVGGKVMLEQRADAREEEIPVEDRKHSDCHAKHLFVWRSRGDASGGLG